jgi:UDP:flavonoid glycosyltransferase YjiC (YdhE family)
MFSLGRMLVDEGHEVVGLSASVMRDRIEAAGAKFYPFPKHGDHDYRNLAALFPEYKSVSTGLEMSRFFLEKVFIDAIPAQDEGLKEVLREFPADIILADNFFLGGLPMLLRQRADRPSMVFCGTMFLHLPRDDGAPNFAGLAPAKNQADLEEYSEIARQHEQRLYAPVRKHLNASLRHLGLPSLDMDAHEAVILLPEAYLQLTVPAFEYPRANIPASVHFVGTLPIIPRQALLPEWADELDGSRKVVLATQGTVSNHDFGQLIVPTLHALANEDDVLVVVTTGGRPIEAIGHAIPGNARVASYLPFEWLLPKVDVLVTNGGYGSVNQALSFGIPLVTAGLSEDKADVNARVAWSGVGIDLQSQEPTSTSLSKAIRTVLDGPNYRSRADWMASEFAKIDTKSEILRILRVLSNNRIKRDRNRPRKPINKRTAREFPRVTDIEPR